MNSTVFDSALVRRVFLKVHVNFSDFMVIQRFYSNAKMLIDTFVMIFCHFDTLIVT